MRATSSKRACRLLVAACALYAAPAAAEGVSAGGGVVYGTEVEEVGLHLDGYYDLSEQVESLWAGGAFNYFFVGSGLSFWALNFNGQYTLYEEGPLRAYGLGGINVTRVSVEVLGVAEGTTEFGLNLGGGAAYRVAEAIDVVGELKYVLSDADQLVVGVGARYHL